jgi:hypothetical protein
MHQFQGTDHMPLPDSGRTNLVRDNLSYRDDVTLAKTTA